MRLRSVWYPCPEMFWAGGLFQFVLLTPVLSPRGVTDLHYILHEFCTTLNTRSRTITRVTLIYTVANMSFDE